MITEILLVIIAGLFTKLLWKRWKTQKCFRELGIRGPDPNLFLGNQLEILQGPSAAVKKWTEMYGTTFGYFEGSMGPTLVTSDLDIIRQVFIKDFSHFMARKPFPFGPDPDGKLFNNIFLARGMMWKRYRGFMSPMFSVKKIKGTVPLVTAAVDTLMDLLEAKSKEGKPVNILPLYQGLTMDVIASTAFGLDIEAQTNPDNEFLRNIQEQFKQTHFPSEPLYRKIMTLCAFAFPGIGSYLFMVFVALFKTGIIRFGGFALGEQLEAVLKDRKERQARGEECRKDFLQYMMDAESDYVDDVERMTISQEDNEKGEQTEGTNDTGTKGKPIKQLTHLEIMGNLALFLNAGYETTSTALSYASYELALNSDVQKRLQDEIDEQIGEKEVDYDDLKKVPYLIMVFNETLRLHTIAPSQVARYCMEETTVKGIKIPKGMMVMPNIGDIHFDPELWGPTDPNVFDPERFSPEAKANRDPLAFQSFGTGPRNCVGMRFALMEAHLALVRIMQKYSFERCEETEVPLEKVEQLTFVPRNGVFLKLVRREK